MGLMHTTQEFNDLVIRADAGRIIRLSDIGRAELGPQDTRSYMKMNLSLIHISLPGNARRTFPGSGETRKTHPRYIFPPLRTHFGRLFATFIYFFVPQKVNFCDESCILSYICIRFPNLNRTFAQ